MASKGLKRKICDTGPCRPSPFFQAQFKPGAGADAFFREEVLQRQENKEEEEKKDPLAEGLKTTGSKLLEHAPFKKWYEPKLGELKLRLWDQASTGDKAAMLGYLGLNLGTAATAVALSPELRGALSGLDIGKPLGWVPYSPVEGFKYKLPGKGETAYGFSADFTFNPYLEALRRRHPGMPLTGATFGLESAYEPQRQSFAFTGGKFGLDFLGGGLKAEGKTFKDLSPYPMLTPGMQPGMPASWLMQEVPGMPKIQRPGYQFTVNADLLKLIPGMAKYW